MATVSELKEGRGFAARLNVVTYMYTRAPALKESLEHRGVLGSIKARIRSEIFSALNDDVKGVVAMPLLTL